MVTVCPPEYAEECARRARNRSCINKRDNGDQANLLSMRSALAELQRSGGQLVDQSGTPAEGLELNRLIRVLERSPEGRMIRLTERRERHSRWAKITMGLAALAFLLLLIPLAMYPVGLFYLPLLVLLPLLLLPLIPVILSGMDTAEASSRISVVPLLRSAEAEGEASEESVAIEEAVEEAIEEAEPEQETVPAAAAAEPDQYRIDIDWDVEPPRNSHMYVIEDTRQEGEQVGGPRLRRVSRAPKAKARRPNKASGEN